MTYNKDNIDELIKLIRKTMIDNDINNNMLAAKLGKSKQYICQYHIMNHVEFILYREI